MYTLTRAFLVGRFWHITSNKVEPIEASFLKLLNNNKSTDNQIPKKQGPVINFVKERRKAFLTDVTDNIIKHVKISLD